MRQIPSHKISFSEAAIAEIVMATGDILRSGNVILGDFTRQFEQEYAQACGRKFGVAVGSDTAAFEMQLKTLDVEDEYVLYPALAFPSILESVMNAGGKPWFFDGAWDGHLFATAEQVGDSIEECKKETGRYPAALILMHTGGLIARDSQKIYEMCEEYDIAVLEDAAHSFGAELDGKPAGSFGLSSAFSLYATKPMHACEGGMIVTDSEMLADECKIYRNYGRTQDFGRSVIVRHGYSWRITEIQSAIGLANLHRMPENLSYRREIMRIYDQMVIDTPAFDEVKTLEMSEGMKPNGYRYILIGPEGWTGEDRLEFKKEVKAAYGVDLPGEVYELPTHKQPIWEEEYGHLRFPMAEEFCDRHFALPVYPGLSPADLEYIVESVGAVLEKYV